MIGVGAPWIFGIAVLGALVTCALHFLSVRRPPVLLLPTMRFLPERPVRAVSRSARPSDLLLLLLRVAAILLGGVALSGLYWRGGGVRHGRVVVVQRGYAFDSSEMRRSVARALEGAFTGDTATRIVMIDSVAHFLTAAESQAFNPETLSQNLAVKMRSSQTLSSAILAATRAASALAREQRNVDVVDLTIAAPFSHEWKDAAVPQVRAMWPGKIRLINMRASDIRSTVDSTDFKRSVAFVGAKPSDAVQTAFAVRRWSSESNESGLTAANPPIALEWPASGTPEGWTAVPAATQGAVIARGEALVFPFAQTARIPESIAAGGRAVAWWSDGEVAAVEMPTATSCTRHVGINVPPSSDVLQGQAARALLLALSGPCGGEADRWPIAAEELQSLDTMAAGATAVSAPASAFQSATVARTPWASMFLLLSIALLVLEWFVRDREERLNEALETSADSVRKVA